MRRVLLPLFVPLVLVALMFGLVPRAFSAPPSPNPAPPTTSTPTPDPTPPTDWLTEALTDIEASEYDLSWQSPTYIPELPGAYQAPNRIHNLRTYFTPDGIQVIRRTETTPSWQWGMSLSAIGFEGATSLVPTATLVISANSIEYLRGTGETPLIVEWYHNEPSGVEQGFHLPAAPDTRPGDAPLVLDFSYSGDLIPVLLDNGETLVFQSADGVIVLYYGHLRAYDSTGTELSSAMELLETNGVVTGIRLRVDDQSATYPLDIDPLVTSPSWTATGSQSDMDFGYAVGTAGDVNNDGYDDVVIGAPRYDNGQTDEGAVFVFHGSSSGPGNSAAWTGESNQAGAQFGFAVAAAGDVNGDGYDDIVVGSPLYDALGNDRGRAFVYYGSGSGITSSGAWVTSGQAGGDQYGFAVASAGDVNHDSKSDVIVGSPYYESGQTDEGKVYVYHGATSGLATTAAWTKESNLASAHYGWSVATAGSINGDVYSDVIIGMPHFENNLGTADEGRAEVFVGTSTGLTTTLTWSAESNQGSAHFGYSVATAGDVNHDGYDDIVVGAPLYDNGQTNEGRAFAWFGSNTGLGSSGTPSNADWSQEANLAGANYGWDVDTAGDTNNDTYADIIVGAPGYSSTLSAQGKVYLYQGQSSGLATAASWSVEGDDSDSKLGASVGSAGNVNGDTFDDVIVGAYRYGSGSFIGRTGWAWVYYGEEAIAGLSATSSGNTFLGNPTFFTATITAGTHVSYEWDFGDGGSGMGNTISHTYAATGTYTAIVTASNGVNVLTDSVVVAVNTLAVSLHISVNRTSVFVEDPRLTVTVEARDQFGALVPGYVGTVEFSSPTGGKFVGSALWRPRLWPQPSVYVYQRRRGTALMDEY